MLARIVASVGIVSSDGQRALAGSVGAFKKGKRVVGRHQTVVNRVCDLRTVFIVRVGTCSVLCDTSNFW